MDTTDRLLERIIKMAECGRGMLLPHVGAFAPQRPRENSSPSISIPSWGATWNGRVGRIGRVKVRLEVHVIGWMGHVMRTGAAKNAGLRITR